MEENTSVNQARHDGEKRKLKFVKNQMMFDQPVCAKTLPYLLA